MSCTSCTPLTINKNYLNYEQLFSTNTYANVFYGGFSLNQSNVPLVSSASITNQLFLPGVELLPKTAIKYVHGNVAINAGVNYPGTVTFTNPITFDFFILINTSGGFFFQTPTSTTPPSFSYTIPAGVYSTFNPTTVTSIVSGGVTVPYITFPAFSIQTLNLFIPEGASIFPLVRITSNDPLSLNATHLVINLDLVFSNK